MSKTFFFDLDGTVISDIYFIDKAVLDMFEKLKIGGHRSFVCTGRGEKYVPEEILKNCSGMITLTGASAAYNGKVLFNHSFSDSFVRGFLNSADQAGINVYLENAETMVLIGRKDSFDDDERIMSKLSEHIFPDYKSLSESSGDFCVNKMSFRTKFTSQIREIVNGRKDIEVLDAGQGWSEMIQSGINKGSAIKEVIKLLNIDYRDTICFGDSGNDIAMFKECAVSIAVGNADEMVKKAADVVTGSCEENGVVEYLKRKGYIE